MFRLVRSQPIRLSVLTVFRSLRPVVPLRSSRASFFGAGDGAGDGAGAGAGKRSRWKIAGAVAGTGVGVGGYLLYRHTHDEKGNRIIRRKHPNGVPLEEYRVDSVGRLQGPSVEWHDNGKMKCRAHYLDDRLDGEVTKWNSWGEMTSLETFRMGELGTVIDWHPGFGERKDVLEYRWGRLARVVSRVDPTGREMVLSQATELDVWKACQTTDGTDVLVRIRVPTQARRVTPFNKTHPHKSRIEYGTVVEITNRDETPHRGTAHDHAGLTYELGKEVRATTFETDPEIMWSGISVQLLRDHALLSVDDDDDADARGPDVDYMDEDNDAEDEDADDDEDDGFGIIPHARPRIWDQNPARESSTEERWPLPPPPSSPTPPQP